MTRMESNGLTLLSTIMFFQVPPRILFYDNACNKCAAALLRLPWLMIVMLVIFDRFHYKSHTCNALYDADRYTALDWKHSFAAESINTRIKKSLSSMRFINGFQLVVYLSVRFALLNIVAKHFELTKKRDIEDEDLLNTYHSLHQCSFICCKYNYHSTPQSLDIRPYFSYKYIIYYILHHVIWNIHIKNVLSFSFSSLMYFQPLY